jgi:hypothetical protein
MPNQIVLTYGDLADPRPCELHGGLATRFGTLIDPNGHKWIICADCINSLWEDKQPNPNMPTPGDPIDMAMEVLKKALRERGYDDV